MPITKIPDFTAGQVRDHERFVDALIQAFGQTPGSPSNVSRQASTIRPSRRALHAPRNISWPAAPGKDNGRMTSAQGNAPDWDTLIADVCTGAGSRARHQVGAWALERIRTALGEDWPQRWHSQNGSLPPFLRDASTHAFAYAQLIETALRLHVLPDVLRFKRLLKDWRRHLEPIRQLHVALQLEVAVLARATGGSVEFETPTKLPTTTRPADVVLAHGEDRIITEVFSVYSDLSTAGAMSYDINLGRRLHLATLMHDVVVSGHWDVRLDGEETDRLIDEVQQACARVATGGPAETVTRPGIELRLAPGPRPEGEVVLEGPETRAAGWRRARQLIRDKAHDWQGSPLPVWLRFDLLDGTGLLSDWATKPLDRKTDWIAALLTEALHDTQTAGVVMSCGQELWPGADEETYVGPNGLTGLRRHLDDVRVREIFIVPLSHTGAQQTALWQRMYEAEPGWTDLALQSADLPALSETRL
ncbi:hypothetical protein ACWCQS_45015 [Streptomyces sp. NPDC002076]